LFSPMLLYKTEPFDDENWVTELKLNGIRMVYSTNNGVHLYTRHSNNVTHQFPEIISPLVPQDTILDGELILTDNQGRPDFEELISRFHTKNSKRIETLAKVQPVTFCAFDVIYYKGKNVSFMPLIERKEILAKALSKTIDNIAVVPFTNGKGKDYFELVKAQKLEGIVLKKADSKVGKRSESWLKSIAYSYEDVLIHGIRKSEFGMLLSYKTGEYAGLLEFGVPPVIRRTVYQLANELKAKDIDDILYLKSPIECKVKFRNKTKAGLLRSPSFVEFNFSS
jgi:DNA ligase 1